MTTGWFEVDRMVDITDRGGQVVGRVAPGHRYQAVEMSTDTVTILGPGGAPGFVARTAVRVVATGGPSGPVTPLQPLVGGHATPASGPAFPPQAARRPAAGRVGMIVVSVLVLLVWGYDMSVNEGLPGYWALIPVSGAIGVICGAIARPAAGVVAILGFAVAGITAGYEAAVTFGPSLDAGALGSDLAADFAFVIPVPVLFVLAIAGMVTGGIMARSRR